MRMPELVDEMRTSTRISTPADAPAERKILLKSDG